MKELILQGIQEFRAILLSFAKAKLKIGLRLLIVYLQDVTCHWSPVTCCYQIVLLAAILIFGFRRQQVPRTALRTLLKEHHTTWFQVPRGSRFRFPRSRNKKNSGFITFFHLNFCSTRVPFDLNFVFDHKNGFDLKQNLNKIYRRIKI